MSSLSLFPSRAAIGRVSDSSGSVLMTPEFSRALNDVFLRIGGAEAPTSAEIDAILSSFKVDILALQSDTDALELDIDRVDVRIDGGEQAPAPQQFPLDDLQLQIAMMDSQLRALSELVVSLQSEIAALNQGRL